MGLVRHRESAWLAGLVVVVVVGSLLAWYVGSRDDDTERATDRSTAQEPTTTEPERPKRRKKQQRTAATAEATDVAAGAGWAGNGELPPGLRGDGLDVRMRTFTLRVSVSSSEPIRTIGLQVPTSEQHKERIYRGVGTSWGVRTTVYGNPDYARVFLQAGPSGAPITCVVSVDGRVTERRSTSGPYGATMCQG